MKVFKCWKAGNKFSSIGIKKSKNHFRKIILAFQHYQTLSQHIFLSGYRGSKCQAIKKLGVSDVPIGKPVVTGYFGDTNQLNSQYPLIVRKYTEESINK